LGDGFDVVRVGSKIMIQSLPRELSSDHTTVLLFAQNKGYVTKSELRSELGWPDSRIDVVLVCSFYCLTPHGIARLNHIFKASLLQDSIAWIDTAEREAQYWFPTIFFGKSNNS